MGEDKRSFMEILTELGELQIKAEAAAYQEEEKFWASLTKEQQLQAFCAVVRRVVDGEFKQGASYRGILYDTFGFGPEAYGAGISCGFIELHNAIPIQLTEKKGDIDSDV